MNKADIDMHMNVKLPAEIAINTRNIAEWLAFAGAAQQAEFVNHFATVFLEDPEYTGINAEKQCAKVIKKLSPKAELVLSWMLEGAQQ